MTPAGRPRLRDLVKEKGFWVLHLVGVLYFFRPLLGGETFFFRDLYQAYLPFEALWIDLLKAGEPPFWNPRLHGGMPLLADVNLTALYPAKLLGFLLAPAAALSVNIVLHVLASAAAAYLLARCLGVRAPAAFVAGAVFGYCGFTLSQANILIRIQSMPYMPLVILFWHFFLVDGRRRWYLSAVACGALQIFAGSPTVVVPTLALALVWGLCLTEARWSRARRAALWLTLVAAVAGMAAPQILPTAELIRHSSRGAGMTYQEFSLWSLHLLRLPELVLPGYLGPINRGSDESYWGTLRVDHGFPYFVSLYVGALALVLALLGGAAGGGRTAHRRLRRALLALAVLAVLLSTGRFLPLFHWLYEIVPGIRLFRYPVKLLAFAVLPLALLAAFGAEVVLARDRAAARRIRRTLVAVWIVLGVPLLLLLLAMHVEPWSGPVLEALYGQVVSEAREGLSRAATHALVFGLLATLVGFLASRSRSPARAWALAAVVLADLLIAGRGLNPTVPSEMITKVPPAARLVRTEIGDGRLFRAARIEDFDLHMPTDDVLWLYRWNQEILSFYLGASYGIPVIYHQDFDGLAPYRTLLLGRVMDTLSWDERWPILAAGSVRVIMTNEQLARPELESIGTIESASQVPVHVYRYSAAAHRLEWIGVWHRVDSPRDALRAMLSPGFDPRRHAVLEAPIDARTRAACDAPARVELLEARASRRTYTVSAPCDGVLVFSETFYPGCEVRIDGRRVPIWPANVAFTAAPVGAGEHRVEWRFVPTSFYRGLAAAALTLLVLGLALRFLSSTAIDRPHHPLHHFLR